MDSRTREQRGAIESFVTRLVRLDETTFCGYAYWHDAPFYRFAVEIILDGEPIGLVRAEQYASELKSLGTGEA